MRKPNEDDLSDGGADTGSVGDGFSAVVDLSDNYYGNSFDDDYTHVGDETVDGGSSDESFEDDLDLDETAFGSDLTEQDAEEILVDMLDETYGSNADEMVEQLEDSTGRSAIEILEDITGLDVDGSDEDAAVDRFDSTVDGGIGATDPFDSPEAPEVDTASQDDFDLNRDGHVDQADLQEATHFFDFDVHDG